MLFGLDRLQILGLRERISKQRPLESAQVLPLVLSAVVNQLIRDVERRRKREIVIVAAPPAPLSSELLWFHSAPALQPTTGADSCGAKAIAVTRIGVAVDWNQGRFTGSATGMMMLDLKLVFGRSWRTRAAFGCIKLL